MNQPPQFFTPAELAERWHLSEQTLANWRTARKGPRFVRLGGAVRYPLAEVLAFEQQGQHKPPKPRSP